MSKAAMSKAAKAKTASSKTTAGPMTDGPLAADMGRLARELSQASKSRVSTANDMRRASTKHVRQMANARRKATIDLRTNLSRDVNAFLDIAAQTVPAFARAHQKMAKQQRSSLEAGRRELGQGRPPGDIGHARFHRGHAHQPVVRRRSNGVVFRHRNVLG